MHPFAGSGMRESKGFGVEGLPGAEGEAVEHELAVAGECGAVENGIAAVFRVVEKGVADMLEVGTNLVRAAGFEHAADDIDVTEAFDHVVMRDGVLAAFATLGVNGHDFAIREVTADIADDGALVFGKVAPANGNVFSRGGLVEKLGGKVSFGFRRFGNDEEAGGVLVDAMDEAGAGIIRGEEGITLEMIGERIDERARVMPVSGMHDKSRGFLDDEKRLVLVNNVERDVLGHQIEFPSGTGKKEGNRVAGLHAIIRAHGLAVHVYAPGFSSGLHAGTGSIGKAVNEEFIHPEGCLSRIRHKAIMFV